jgi:hypothetical protein
MSKKDVLYYSGSDICTVHVPVPVLFLFQYPYCRSSDTPSHLILEGSMVNRYLHSHSVPTLHVIWYPYSMSSGTHTPCHQVLNSFGTNTALIRYSKLSGTKRFYSQPIPAQSFSTQTPCHPVPIIHVIQYSVRLVPTLRSSNTPSHPVPEGSTSHPILTLHVIQYPHSMSSGTHIPYHLVLTLHIIQYLQFNTSRTIMFQKLFDTRMLQVIRYQASTTIEY